MTIKGRLDKLDKAVEVIGRKNHPPRVFVYYDGDEYGDLIEQNRAQRLKVSDFRADARKDDTVLRVVFEDTKPITNMAEITG